MATDSTQGTQRSARWNVISVCIPFVGFVVGVVVGAGGRDVLWDGHPMDGVMWGFRVWFGFCALGLLSALIAIVRSERMWGVTLVGFLLNVPLLGLSSLFLGGR